ncbi:MAG: DUF3137 domain-containing protein [Ruminococcus sp.]|nr:DUF3137 domain-containing protein [Ruminococcus sp.]
MNEEAVRRLEEINKKNNRKTLPYILILVALFILLAVSSELWNVKVTVLILAAGAAYLVYLLKVVYIKGIVESEELALDAYDIFVPEILFPELSKSFDRLSWNRNDMISEQEFADIGIFSVYNEYRSRGLITGSYKGMNVRMSPVSSIWDRHDRNAKQGRMVMFGGWVYAIDLPFSVGGVKIISDKDVTSPLMPSKRYAVDAFGTKITPHDIELDKNFDVYTTSYDEAGRLLQPVVIEAMVYAHRKLWYYSKNRSRFRLAFGFVGNRLYMMVQDAYSGFRWSTSKIDVSYKTHFLERDIDVITTVFDSIASLTSSQPTPVPRQTADTDDLRDTLGGVVIEGM